MKRTLSTLGTCLLSCCLETDISAGAFVLLLLNKFQIFNILTATSEKALSQHQRTHDDLTNYITI
jgi:hypothetical protein